MNLSSNKQIRISSAFLFFQKGQCKASGNSFNENKKSVIKKTTGKSGYFIQSLVPKGVRKTRDVCTEYNELLLLSVIIYKKST